MKKITVPMNCGICDKPLVVQDDTMVYFASETSIRAAHRPCWTAHPEVEEAATRYAKNAR